MYSLFFVFFFLCLCFCFLSCLFYWGAKNGFCPHLIIGGGACPGCPPESTPMSSVITTPCPQYSGLPAPYFWQVYTSGSGAYKDRSLLNRPRLLFCYVVLAFGRIGTKSLDLYKLC